MTLTITLIILFCVLVFITLNFLLINSKDSVVDSQKYLGRRNNQPEIYATPSDGLIYSPFDIEVVAMDKLMLVDIADDPEYKSIELQTFNDSRGHGARVLLYHHNGPADVYYTNNNFKIMLTENARYVTDPDIKYYFEVTESGLDAWLKMKDSKGKSIEFRVKETLRRKWSKGFLAPVGGNSAVTFSYFPFFHMKDMNFVLRSGTEFTVRIDGVDRSPKKLPIPVNLEFVYLSRYTDAPVMAEWNKPHDGQMVTLHGDEQIKEKGTGTTYNMVDNSGHSEIRKMTGFNERHEAFFEFSPPMPDLVCLKDGADIEGRFCAGADSVEGIVAGTYLVKRKGNIIEMEVRPLKGWQPVPGKIWVRTWIWKSTITIATDKSVTMKSSWIRKQ